MGKEATVTALRLSLLACKVRGVPRVVLKQTSDCQEEGAGGNS